MQSFWNDRDAASAGDTPLALRVYTSRLLGREPSLVLHGGGNTSVKAGAANLFGEPEELIHVKGSGWDLATIEAAGFSPVRLAPLRQLADLPVLTDAEMVRAQRAAMTDPFAPTPSVEAILHALIPFAFVDHTHADAVVAVSNTPDGEARIREIYGDRVLVVPYVMPGFILARTVHEMTRGIDWRAVDGMVLLHHGVFSFADDARASYERMIALVTKAEEHLARHRALESAPSTTIDEPASAENLRDLAALRQAISRSRGRSMIAAAAWNADAARFASRPDVAAIATRGPLTPDHVIRTKPLPLIAEGPSAVDRYAREYREYFGRHRTEGLTCLDPAPRWVIQPGRGWVTFGASAQEAAIVGDIARHTARAVGWAEALGGWCALPEKDLFEVEYWELEQAKLKKGGAGPALAGKVALVTGAASGIGRAVAEALQKEGAAVVATDIDPRIAEHFSGPDLMGLVADATDAGAVRRSVEETVRRFGGLDLLVTNAGLFPPSARLEAMDDALWARSLDLNLTSHLHLLRAAVPYLRFGVDPSVVVIASKNVPAPGPGAGAYSVAKAGLTQLARVAALELGKDGIRVNTLHPHLVLDTAAWTPEVLAARAANYGMSVEEYKHNNLLGTEITTKDVAAAVVALAGPAFAKTTGAQIPIDGGSDRVV